EDDVYAGGVCVIGRVGLADRVAVGEHRLPDDLHGDVRGGFERLGAGAGLRGDLAERLRAVQALAAGQAPDLAGLEGVVHGSSSLRAVAAWSSAGRWRSDSAHR